MKAILKIAFKSLVQRRGRTLFTLVCVMLAVSIVVITYGITDTLMRNLEFTVRKEEIAARNLCIVFVTTACAMSVYSIMTAFSVSEEDRIKHIGILSSVGASPRQTVWLILFEALIYAVVGVALGTALGFAIASRAYGALEATFQEEIGEITMNFRSVSFAALLGLSSVMLSAFSPIRRMRKMSLLDTFKTNAKINVRLKPSALAYFISDKFGRIGSLASQSYDNNSARYRAIALIMSGAPIFFITVYSFAAYYYWDDLYKGKSVSEEQVAFIGAVAFFMLYFIFVFLFCALGSLNQNMNERKREFAMYKSIGMDNGALYGLMSLECLFLVGYAVIFGFIGSLAGNYIVWWTFLMTDYNLSYHYPLDIFGWFIVMDIAVAVIFIVYSCRKIRRVNIIEAIRG